MAKKDGSRKPGNPANRNTARFGSAQPTGNTDPLGLGGSMSGPGGPRDRNAVCST